MLQGYHPQGAHGALCEKWAIWGPFSLMAKVTQ